MTSTCMNIYWQPVFSSFKKKDKTKILINSSAVKVTPDRTIPVCCSSDDNPQGAPATITNCNNKALSEAKSRRLKRLYLMKAPYCTS